MKLTYTKPLLGIENFSMLQSTARDCADTIPKDQLTFGDIANCVWDLGGGTTVFVGGSTCTLDGQEMGVGCYNNPGEGNYIFRS